MPDAMEIIRHSVAKLDSAESPEALRPRIAGEIDMAYKLDLITYQERDHLMGNMIAACGRRRNELHRAKLARLGIEQ